MLNIPNKKQVTFGSVVRQIVLCLLFAVMLVYVVSLIALLIYG